MFRNKSFALIASLCLSVQPILFAQVENSVIPTIEKFENIENIPKNKISDNHFKKIETAFEKLDQKVRIVTYNLLCDDREEKVEQINKWKNRVPRVIELFKEIQPDIICIQEQYQHQLDAWLPELGEGYSFYGAPRSDGEMNGVIYRNDRFELIEGAVTTVPSPRHKTNNFTMVQLKDLKTDKSFAIFNTHMTFGSNNEREREAELIKSHMTEVAQNMPVMLTGDLNLFPCRLEMTFPYFDGDRVNLILTNDLLKNAKEISLLGHLGPISTFTNDSDADTTPFKGLGTPGVMLDRIYVSKGIDVLIHAVQPATVDGYFPSDHMPLLMDFILTE